MVSCRADGDHIVEPILKYVLTTFNFFSSVSRIFFVWTNIMVCYKFQN